MRTSILSFFLAVVSVECQYGGYSDTPAAKSGANREGNGHINIDVTLEGQLKFSPETVTASVGSLVSFWYPAGATHSVTQSTFSAPCTYLEPSNGTLGGFDSGLQTSSTGLQYTINVTNTDPIWFYCKQENHCGQGMVGSINAPTSGNTFLDFQSKAKQVGGSATQKADSGPIDGGVNAKALGPPTPISRDSSAQRDGAALVLVDGLGSTLALFLFL